MGHVGFYVFCVANGKIKVDNGKFFGKTFHMRKNGGIKNVNSGESEFGVFFGMKIGKGRLHFVRFLVYPTLEMLVLVEQKITRSCSFAAYKRSFRLVIFVKLIEFG